MSNLIKLIFSTRVMQWWHTAEMAHCTNSQLNFLLKCVRCIWQTAQIVNRTDCQLHFLLKFVNCTTFFPTLLTACILDILLFHWTVGFYLRKFQPLKIKSIFFVRFKFLKQIWHQNKIINRKCSSDFKFQTFVLFMMGAIIDAIIALLSMYYLHINSTFMYFYMHELMRSVLDFVHSNL